MILASHSCRPLLANHRRHAPGGHSATPFRTVPRSRTDANVGSLDLGAFVSQVLCASRLEPRLPPSCRFPRRTTVEYRTGHHIVHRPCRIATTSSRVHLAPRASQESMPQSWGLPPLVGGICGDGRISCLQLVSLTSWRSSTRRFFAWVLAMGPRRGPSTTASRPPPR